MKVIVLAGGDSSEKEISLRTGECVYNTLIELGYQVEMCSITTFKDVLNLEIGDNTLIFNALHGGFGEDGTLQSYLSYLNLPYNGANALASSIGMNKEVTKKLASTIGISIPKSMLITKTSILSYEKVKCVLGSKFVLKPLSQGCSVGLYYVTSKEEYDTFIPQALEIEESVILEEFITGIEVTVGMLGEEILPLVEIKHNHDLFDYESKFTPGMSRFIQCELPENMQKNIQKQSKEFFNLLDITDYARLDFIVDESGKAYLLELNTLPGLNTSSLYPVACKFMMLDYKEMMQRLVQLIAIKKGHTQSVG